MNSNFAKPAIAALALAVLFPIYWLSAFYWGSDTTDIFSFLKTDMTTFSRLDILFLIIGVLEVYVYFSLATSLKDRINSKSLEIILMIMVASSAMFHATVIIDIILQLLNGSMSSAAIDMTISVGLIVSIGALFVLSLSTLICSIMLITKHHKIASTLKVFSILLLIVSFLQLSVLFSVFNLFMFPCTLVLLAMYFFKDPDSLEVL